MSYTSYNEESQMPQSPQLRSLARNFRSTSKTSEYELLSPKMVRGGVLKQTPRKKPRHEDSQLQFEAIDSSPVEVQQESQLLTDRQKEVADRQKSNMAIFPDIRSSVSVNRTISALVLNSDVVVASSDPEGEPPSTPVFPTNDAQDDCLPNSSPIVASVSRRRSDSRRAVSLSAKKPLPDPEPQRDFPSSPPDASKGESIHAINSHMTEDSDICMTMGPTQLQCSEETETESGRLVRQNHTVLNATVVEEESNPLDNDLPQHTQFPDERSMEILAARPDSPCSSDALLPAAQLAAEMQASFAEQTQQDISEDNALANTNPTEGSDLESASVSAAEVAIDNVAPPEASPLALVNSIEPVKPSTEQSPMGARTAPGESIVSPIGVSQPSIGLRSLRNYRRFSAPAAQHSKRLVASKSSVSAQPETHKSQEPELSFSSPSLSSQSNLAMVKRSLRSPALATSSKRTKTSGWVPKPPRQTVGQSSSMEFGCINVLSTEEGKRPLKTIRNAPAIKTSPVFNDIVRPSTEHSRSRQSSRLRSSHALSSPKDASLPKTSRSSPVADPVLTPDPIVTSQRSQSRRSNRLSDSQAEHSTGGVPPRRRRKRQSVQPADAPQAAVEAGSSKKRKGMDGKALASEVKSRKASLAVVIPLQTSESPAEQDNPESPLAIRKILSPKSIMAKLRALIAEAGEVVFGKDEQTEVTDAAFELVAVVRGYKTK
jgi:hypothetical protein